MYLQLLNLLLISQVRKFIYTVIILVFISFSGYCQIQDDSTKQIYSAATTQFFTIEDVIGNTNHKNHIDTSLLNLHNYNYYYKNNILYQDLGNFGTPVNRIYYEPPITIGKKLGFSTLNEFGYTADNLNYYDTKSPYTKLFYIQGSKGQQSLEVEHTRNIKPNWNAGFILKRAVAVKQLASGVAKEFQMSHYSFAAHTSYFSKNKRYTFLFSFTHLDHSQYENGGIFVDSNETKEDMFDYKLEKVQLYSLPNSRTRGTHLRSYQKSSNFRFYNDYSILPKKSLQLFHQFDYQTIKIRYDDDYLSSINSNGLDSNLLYYPAINFDSTATRDRIFNELYENKIGIKGSSGKLFYMAYLRRKDFSYIQTNYTNVVRSYNENFIGGKAEYRFTDTLKLGIKAEYYLGRDYTFQADFSSQLLDAGYQRISYSPTLFQLKNVSNSYEWDNNFSNTITDVVYVTAKLKNKFFFFSPMLNFSNINNFIYYDTLSIPKQSSLPTQITSVGFSAGISYRILHLENYLRYSKVSGADVIRVPELFNQTKLYLYGALFKKALRLQIGVDLSWKSGYYGNSYSPGTQQFHLSSTTNDFNYLDGYLLADAFINTQIKRGFVFLKWSHVNMGMSEKGYFITPYYTALPRSFEFGVRWLFYD